MATATPLHHGLGLTQLPGDDPRVVAPLYTVRETAAYLGVPFSTFHTWVRGYHRSRAGKDTVGAALIQAFPAEGPSRTLPFLGLIEGHVLNAFRSAGVSLPKIRAALTRLQADVGVAHALASQHLYTDRVEVLYEYAEREGHDVVRSLVEVRSGQRVLRPLVEQYLRLVTWDSDAWPTSLRLRGFERANVIVDPQRAFGRPVFQHGGTRVEDVVHRFYGGDDVNAIAEDFGVDVNECLEAIRVLGRSQIARAA